MSKVLRNAPIGALCNTFDLQWAIITYVTLKNSFMSFWVWPFYTGFTVCAEMDYEVSESVSCASKTCVSDWFTWRTSRKVCVCSKENARISYALDTHESRTRPAKMGNSLAISIVPWWYDLFNLVPFSYEFLKSIAENQNDKKHRVFL